MSEQPDATLEPQVAQTEPPEPASTLEPVRVRFARVLQLVDVIRRDQEAVVETRGGGEYRYNYTDINGILAMLKPVLASHMLALAQPIVALDDSEHVTVATNIMCSMTGDTIAYSGPIIAAGRDPQAFGSALTYMRRYALVSLFALEAIDDDGAQAHRAAVDPHHRTPAETQIREIITQLSTEQQSAFIADFRDAFSCTLTELPESRHGAALGWAMWWVSDDKFGEDGAQPNPAPTEEESY